MTWPTTVLLVVGLLLAFGVYLTRLLLAPRESARNAELLKKVQALEGKLRTHGGPEEKTKPPFPFHMGGGAR